jgi:hypothetical protein
MGINGAATLNATASATGVQANALADVYATDVKGFNTDVDLSAAGDATLTGTASATTNVTASNTGDTTGTDLATASSIVDDVVGIDADASGILVDVDGDVTANGSATASQTATAGLTTGNARATIDGTSVTGAAYSTAAAKGIDAAGDATVTGTATVNNNATASTSTGTATAFEEVATTTGLIDDLTVGGVATINGTASVNGAATASSTSDTANADSGTGLSAVTGYDAAGAVNVGGDAGITARATTDNTATASSTSGTADADAIQGTVYGLDVLNGESFQVKGDAKIDADAIANGTAIATSTNAASTANVNANDVDGIRSDVWTSLNPADPAPATLNLDGNADVNALAQSTQSATASTATGAATANTGASDSIIGSDRVVYDIEGNATQFDTRGILSATSTSNSVTGDATSKAGVDSESVGFENRSIKIAGNATGEFAATPHDAILNYGVSTLTTTAGTKTGDANASSTGVVVQGAEDLNLDVAGNIAKRFGARQLAVGTFNATAQSVNGDDTGTKADIDADVAGFSGKWTDIDISGNGNLTQVGQSKAVSNASTIGDNAGVDSATANVDLDAKGGDYTRSLGGITISGNGNVQGDGVTLGSSSATGFTSAATAMGDLDAGGLILDDSNLVIGGTGNTLGRGLIGSWAPSSNGDYTHGEAFDITAETHTGDATASGDSGVADFDAVGISGSGTVTAGPSAGNITGIAGAAGNISATTTTGNADSDTDADLFGIKNVNLQGGRDGSSLLDGRAQGIFTTSSNSVTGEATADSNVSAYGFQGSSSTAAANGNINALAEISNVVSAMTTSGTATANAIGNAVGIQNYAITMEGHSVITAEASTQITAQSSSMGGLDTI